MSGTSQPPPDQSNSTSRALVREADAGAGAPSTAPREGDFGRPPVRPSPFLLRAAERLYAECERAIQAGRIDARSPIGDATLDYRELREDPIYASPASDEEQGVSESDDQAV